MKWVYKVSLGFFFVLNGVLLGQNVGIGTAVPGSKLGVAGNLSVGVGYAGTAAPANGAITLKATSASERRYLHKNYRLKEMEE